MQEWSREEIEAFINDKKTGLLYLYTPLCGTCQVAGKMLMIIKELMSDLSIGKSDLNYISDIADQWEVESVPCLLIFKEGRLDEKMYAFHSVPYLLEKIKKTI
ncbi:thioredoxin family protein [Cytobacillus dafuensis]|uniref:Thioredoxin family protein n=1 Tax=Cytobacillus dafuensis TaxID=1742359 RepID=A0A5B8Z8G0_CYTDA|nr:thioredoxin family protein [Cytobacillus dafuensis]QED49238.1 thioredoxin family protein [Cytobacillus dafuensis]